VKFNIRKHKFTSWFFVSIVTVANSPTAQNERLIDSDCREEQQKGKRRKISHGHVRTAQL